MEGDTEYQQFLRYGNNVMKITNVCIGNQFSRLASQHGITPGLCTIVWSLLQQKPGFDPFANENHLLWALSWLKTDFREAGAHKTCGMDK